jgi:hypothetical protein
MEETLTGGRGPSVAVALLDRNNQRYEPKVAQLLREFRNTDGTQIHYHDYKEPATGG